MILNTCVKTFGNSWRHFPKSRKNDSRCHQRWNVSQTARRNTNANRRRTNHLETYDLHTTTSLAVKGASKSWFQFNSLCLIPQETKDSTSCACVAAREHLFWKTRLLYLKEENSQPIVGKLNIHNTPWQRKNLIWVPKLDPTELVHSGNGCRWGISRYHFRESSIDIPVWRRTGPPDRGENKPNGKMLMNKSIKMSVSGQNERRYQVEFYR